MSMDGGMKVMRPCFAAFGDHPIADSVCRHVAARFTSAAIGRRRQTLPATGWRCSSPYRPGYAQVAT
ncbi:hypothetical protein WS62_05035 [Burkholderia sp. ABCPW 14]|nr:hypothetical protein WS62_05035 [Burkholderia sp. ABCPW 14]